MKIFKFGGASVKNADGVRNITQIVATQGQGGVVVVVSAMGQTTNRLEHIVNAYTSGDTAAALTHWQQLADEHNACIQNLNGDFSAAQATLAGLRQLLKTPTLNVVPYPQQYDAIVSLGEVLSTQIVAAYMQAQGLAVQWLDARALVRTDDTFREGRVDWGFTCQRITQTINLNGLYVVQGFLGQTPDGRTTTLGRDGSDYTAGIFAHCLHADSVTIWKDVPGVLNADPKWFDDTVLLDRLTYQDAIELAYYGATVIHPKTIKPLQNKEIPLYVRSFLKPQQPGTVIGPLAQQLATPSFIFKMNQVLISLHPLDFSFIAEENLSRIFAYFAEHRVKINLMQNTAISFSVVVDNHPDRIPVLLDRLRDDFRVTYNEGVELITIRYYDQPTIDRVLTNKQLLLEQKSRYTVQLVARNAG